jgi:hypothetical protein
VKTNTPGNLRRGCSGADSQDVTVTYELSRSQTDASFLRATLALLLVLVGGVTKGLIEHRLDRHSTAVASEQ